MTKREVEGEHRNSLYILSVQELRTSAGKGIGNSFRNLSIKGTLEIDGDKFSEVLMRDEKGLCSSLEGSVKVGKVVFVVGQVTLLGAFLSDP